MKEGDIILFQGSGPVFWVFDKLLWVFDSYWRKQPKPRRWHMAIAWKKHADGWDVIEGISPCVRVGRRDLKGTKWYSWLDKSPTGQFKRDFEKRYIGKRYDVAIYFWTMLQYLIRHYWNKRIPRLLDNRYTCWELADAFSNEIGKPWCSPYDCVLITDFLKACDKEGIKAEDYDKG